MWGIMQPLIAPALPQIAASLNQALDNVAWLLTAFLLSAAIATPIIGRLGDIAGKRRVLLLVLAVVVAGSLIDALSHSLGVLIVGRVLQGVGAGVFPLMFGITRDEFPPRRMPGVIGLISVTLGIGSGIGIILSGVIADHLDYHDLFWLQVVSIGLCVAATRLLVPESTVRSPAGINWVGAGLLSAGLATLLLAISKSSAWGWGSANTAGLLVAAVLSFTLWAISELRSPHPLVDMRTMRIQTVWATNLTAALLGVGMFSAFVLVPQLAQTPRSSGYGLGSSVTGAGLLLLPMTLTMFILGLAAGKLQRTFGPRLILIAGCVIATAAYVVMLVAHGSATPLYLATGLLGIGVGLGFAAMSTLIVQVVPAHETGMATGFNVVARAVGSATGSAITATLLASSVNTVGTRTESGYNHAFALDAIALALAVGAAFLIPRRKAPGVVTASR
jgi:EmrB/QacA subfamily drug resistance transporter